MSKNTSKYTYELFKGLFRKEWLLLVFLLVTVKSITGQGKVTPAYQVKSAFLYNFTRFVEWPQDSFASSESQFIIGVIGNNQISSFLEEIVRGEHIGNHPIIVHKYRSIAEVKDCNILFISSEEAPRAKNMLSKLQKRSILTVSDSKNFLRMGGIVGFYTDDNKIRLQINAGSARNARLQISSKLLNVASVFNE